MASQSFRQTLITSARRNPALRTGLTLVVACVLGVAAGAAAAFGPVWAGFVVLLAIGCGYALMINTSVGLAAVILITTVLPFGTLPFKAVVTPNFLELTLLALLGVWVLRLFIRPEEPLHLTPLGLPIIGFLGLTLFSFVIGSGGSPDSLTLHNYFKFVLAVLFFFSVVNCVRDQEQARFGLRMLVLGGALAALIGLVLYALNDATSLRLLVSLGRIGYPTSGRVLRYVEDDVNGVERAIGLSVDPNSFGGMLALIGAIAITQVVARRPLLPRPMMIAIAGMISLTVLLTQSRAALGGLVVAVTYVATLRYRRLWWLIIAIAAAALVLIVGFGLGDRFVERITQGVQFRDQANQMRLAEYRNAIAVIQAYPFFGIGFGRAPELDLTAGVSSVYLAVAQRTGLIGLAAFLAIMATFFISSWHSMQSMFRHGNGEELASWLLALQSSIAAALAVGLLDHYFFNIEFGHMVALFWGVIGFSMAIATIWKTEQSRDVT